MNLITEQQRLETYRNAPEDIREIYVSDNFVEHIDRLILLFEITKPYKEVSEIIGDTILGFYKISDMPRLFQQKLDVSADVSQRMTSQLIEFLAPVVKREEEASKLQAESKATLIQTFATPQLQQDAEKVTPQSHTQVAPLRTMEGDITRIHGYGAVQTPENASNETPVTSSQEQLLSKE
jgi:hypothetical protein